MVFITRFVAALIWTTACATAFLAPPSTISLLRLPPRKHTSGACSLRAAGGAAVDKAALAALEKQGIAASEAWDTVITDFFDPDFVTAATSLLEDRADIGFAKVGGYASASRKRFVFTNPDLLDSLGTADSLAAEHTVLLSVSAAFDKSGNRLGAGGSKLPNLLAGIGVEFDQLGDILYDEGSGKSDNLAYVVCAPSIRKTIERLLPKSLGRSTIEAKEPGFEPQGSLVELVITRTDDRPY